MDKETRESETETKFEMVVSYCLMCRGDIHEIDCPHSDSERELAIQMEEDGARDRRMRGEI